MTKKIKNKKMEMEKAKKKYIRNKMLNKVGLIKRKHKKNKAK